MTGNTVQGVTSWLFGLLFRRPRTVPSRLRLPWLAGLLAYLVFAAALTLVALAKARVTLPPVLADPVVTGTAAALAAVFGIVATRWLAPVAGDAARYLSATPDNVAARQKIRDAGVDLLEKLQSSGRYDRIIVLGHSLGSVVAFDVLNCAWGRMKPQVLQASHSEGSPALAALIALEEAAGALTHANTDDDQAKAQSAYRSAQRDYAAALRNIPNSPWLVSDFVTVGSPLSKADVLLAYDEQALEQKKQRREAPTSPPVFEVDKPGVDGGVYRFSFPADAEVRIPHHAAVFAPVVWTNIYFPSFAIVFGDMISGECAPQLGRGIRDIKLRIGGPVFRHLDYWKGAEHTPLPDRITALRKAVNLRLQSEDQLWPAPRNVVEGR